MRQQFNGCEPDYIRDVCHASCCRSSTDPSGTRIAVAPVEVISLARRGAVVIDGYLQSVARRCPFQAADGLCGLHGTGDKPFGCIASPFILTSRGTLIVRNRYRMLKCYRDGRRLPAYVAFRSSLDLLFGPAEAARIVAHLEAGGGDLTAQMLGWAGGLLGTLHDIRGGTNAST